MKRKHYELMKMCFGVRVKKKWLFVGVVCTVWFGRVCMTDGGCLGRPEEFVVVLRVVVHMVSVFGFD